MAEDSLFHDERKGGLTSPFCANLRLRVTCTTSLRTMSDVKVALGTNGTINSPIVIADKIAADEIDTSPTWVNTSMGCTVNIDAVSCLSISRDHSTKDLYITGTSTVENLPSFLLFSCNL
jgi:hypothetical protein